MNPLLQVVRNLGSVRVAAMAGVAAVLEAVAQEDDAITHQDPAMQAVLELADQIAPADASVLINGESGTGKELMARYIHSKSGRPAQKFVAINCAAIPETPR